MIFHCHLVGGIIVCCYCLLHTDTDSWLANWGGGWKKRGEYQLSCGVGLPHLNTIVWVSGDWLFGRMSDVVQ